MCTGPALQLPSCRIGHLSAGWDGTEVSVSPAHRRPPCAGSAAVSACTPDLHPLPAILELVLGTMLSSALHIAELFTVGSTDLR